MLIVSSSLCVVACVCPPGAAVLCLADMDRAKQARNQTLSGRRYVVHCEALSGGGEGGAKGSGEGKDTLEMTGI